MNNFSTPQPDPSKSNPYAASTRLQSKTMSQAYGQRRHDLRIGKQPNYVDLDRKELNRTLVPQRPLPDIRNEITELRRRRGAQRALKSNAAILKSGIITFGTEAAKMFNALPHSQQDAAFIELTQLLAKRLETRVEGLVVHLDETQIHAHFELRAFASDGQPICKLMNRSALSEFQDMTADVMRRFCPDIQRGNSKRDRLKAGAPYSDTLNRSVRQLHEDLPYEIAQREKAVRDLDADIVARQVTAQKDKDRIAALEARNDLNETEQKRLQKYRTRLKKKEVALKEIAQQLRAARGELANKQEVLAAKEAVNRRTTKALKRKAEEADEKQAKALKDAQQAKECYEASIAAVECIIDEMAEGTLQETPDEIILKNPAPIMAAPKPTLNRLNKIVHRYLDMQQEWRKRSEWLDKMVMKVRAWLGRGDLPEVAREDGGELSKEWDLSLDLPDPKPPWAK
ncbi:plasmid recombination protein [Sulfitobacter pontiacus]|uniref:plasmid recombination protein n=1 Tax=Sulfitobacter pontiacus TaxID=60137 RepID=UPI0015E01B1B|nr:plasmid recombination protein [Sulfitobacter pontiacus]QLL42054.1 hypothetical protein G6548_05735 [Sulfitobacter pontiacus]